ncbi:hypothetical protein BV25DRAFT_1631323 [Artomyces pyxidatus]|uniref:Uncharacterized protein n=1 Tax=Artomyces pyxidatus TaxID=48021 RepID=A0ACB8SKQ2_9AGAM|nr:hypothetical protein BV25DRAFT_1631323 [Artomyces pyxidatus]
MTVLNDDVFHLIACEISRAPWHADRQVTLASFSSVSRRMRAMLLPTLFCTVSWPHKRKADDERGLHFFPGALWTYFRHFKLDWPHEWLDPYPPKWGTYGSDPYSSSYYIPRYLETLIAALPSLRITQFTIRCPFIPPPALLTAVLSSSTLTTLTFDDTPLDCSTPVLAGVPTLLNLTLVAVGEALRIGDGKVDPRISDIFYSVRGWKARYRARRAMRLPAETATATALLTQHAPHLRSLQLSGDLCFPAALAACDWPALHTFVLTGHIPAHGVVLSAALARMPQVRDVRLLLSEAQDGRVLLVLPPYLRTPAMLPPTLTHLAVSTACALKGGLLARGPALEAVAIVSIMDFPRLPIALSLGDASRLVRDLAEGARPRHLRLMIEDKLTPAFCAGIAARLPLLEVLEIEICGYHDGKPVFEWNQFATALGPLTRIRSLRICIQFPEFDDGDGAPWKDVRRQCALYLAVALPTLRRIGLEFRERTGTHKYQDSWLEFDIVRQSSNGGNDKMCVQVDLELQPIRSYMFPEVWETVTDAYE